MENYENLIQKIKSFDAFEGQILLNEPIAPKTTFKIGGSTDIFIKPKNYYSFQIVLDSVLAAKIRFFILGGGSNIVFTDQAFHGVVISTQDFSDIDFFNVNDCPKEFGNISLKKNQVLVTCFSGTSIASLVHFCTQNNLSGLEEFAGLPGTVGGALFMNARCFNKSISDVLFSSSFMDYSSGKVKLNKMLTNPEQWDYKTSPYQNKQIFITTATFFLVQQKASEHEQLEAACKKFINERVEKGHFKYPSAGSVFRNNRDFGKPSGQIIDEAGLKGFKIGNAQVAPFHGNFIINLGGAKATEIRQLVEHIQSEVNNKYGFNLNPEIIFVDN